MRDMNCVPRNPAILSGGTVVAARMLPIRTASEITAQIVIPANNQIILYKTCASKAKQLHISVMSYKAISTVLKISRETARKACRYN